MEGRSEYVALLDRYRHFELAALILRAGAQFDTFRLLLNRISSILRTFGACRDTGTTANLVAM